MSITARGGYQIADFKNISIPVDNTTVEIPGIYEQIKNGGKKPIVAYNLNIDEGYLTGIYYINYVNTIPGQNIILYEVKRGDSTFGLAVQPGDKVGANEGN